MIKSVYFLVFVVFYFCLYADAEEKSLTIKHNNKNYDLISFIEKYKKDLNSMTNVKKKIIMVLGMTSSGKSTLINYLNNIPLICSKTQFNKYILELEFENKTLPGGFAIGHKIHSQTFLPAGYTPPGKDFSFIDNPGFKDTHGLAIEIANGFFREEITKNANEIKFLLLLPFDDLTDKGLKFRASIKAFSRFIGAFKDQDTKNLSKSIGIIITKVEHDGVDENTKKDVTKTDEQMKYILKFRLKEILQDEEENKKLSKNENFVFNEIIENDQFEIFSNPKIRGPVSTHQANEINNFIINKLKYSDKDGLKIRVEIDEYKDDLFEYVHYFYSKFEKDFNYLFETAITKYFNRKKFIKENFQNLHIQLSNLKDTSSEENDLNDFLEKLNSDILKIEEKNDLKEKKEMFSYFIHLFSESEKKIFTLKKIWLNNKNRSKILHFINILELEVLEHFEEYFRFVSYSIQNGIDNFVERKMYNAVQINDIYQLISILNEFNQLINSHDFVLKSINNEILNVNDSKIILDNKKELESIISILSFDKKNKLEKKFVESLINKTDYYIKELNIYYEDIKSTFEYGVYTYKGYFANLNTILETINNNDKIMDLKSIEIYAINSVNFDKDYWINSNKYNEKVPDLIVVSRQIQNSKPINVILTSDISSISADPKANNGSLPGDDGDDGNDGLPGLNGGNMLIITNDKISNKIKCLTNGGKGGPGQDG